MGGITISDKVATGQAAGTTLTQTITNNASANTMMHASVQGLSATLTNRTAISVKAAGTNMTKYCVHDDPTGTLQGSMWYLLSPPTGAVSVIVTFGASASGSAVSLTTWNGVQQSGQPDSTNAVTYTTETNPSITNTCVAANCLLTGNMIKNLTTGSLTAGGGQTVLNNAAVGTGWWGEDDYALNVPTGTNIFTYTFSLTSPNSVQLGAFVPAATSTSSPQANSDLRLMGVGQ